MKTFTITLSIQDFNCIENAIGQQARHFRQLALRVRPGNPKGHAAGANAWAQIGERFRKNAVLNDIDAQEAAQ